MKGLFKNLVIWVLLQKSETGLSLSAAKTAVDLHPEAEGDDLLMKSD